MSRNYRVQDGTDAPGVISLIFGCLAVVCLLMGFFTCGATYYAALPFAVIGSLVGFFGRGNLRVAGLLLNFLALIPAVIVMVFVVGIIGAIGSSAVASKNDNPTKNHSVSNVDNPTVDAKSWVDEEIRRRRKTAKEDHTANQRVDNKNRSPETHASSRNDSVDWLDARKPVCQGDVEVAINYIVTDIVGEFGDDAMLLISLSVRNISDKKRIDYESWSKSDTSHIATLADNSGNKYKRIDFGFGTRILSHEVASDRGVIASGRYILLRGSGDWWPVKESSLNPGACVEEHILAFQLPVDSVSYLRLELPASAFGETGSVRFRIPQEMIDKWSAKRIKAKQEQQEEKRRVDSMRRSRSNRKPPLKQEIKQNKKTDKEQDEDAAAVKLKIAKRLHSDSLSVDGKEEERLEREYIDTLHEVVKKYPMTKAAKEAKELLDKIGK